MKNIALFTIFVLVLSACGPQRPQSSSGVAKVTAKIQPQANGLTVEQDNVSTRLTRDNKVGSIKHLYVISAMTGDVLIYSTVKGKVTSSGKRLTPTTVTENSTFSVRIGNRIHTTQEVLQDDGTYGSSVPYVFWFDQKGVYHQHYITGGQIFHVTDAPLSVGKAIINMEQTRG